MQGRLAFNDSHAMRDIIAAIDGAPRRLVFDLSGLDFLDSAGLGMLLLVREEANSKKWPLLFKGAQGQVRRMLHLTRFDSLAQMED